MKKITPIVIVFMLIFIFLLPSCEKVDFKVNFIVDDEVYATVNTSGKEAISIPQNPSKDGYTFDGWYWDKSDWKKPFTANSLLDEPLSSDMNVYAKWRKVKNEPESPPIQEITGTDIWSGFLSISDEKGTLTVSNETETFSFLNDIVVAEDATYIIAKDIECENVITSKTVALSEGDNTYYLLVTNGSQQKLYTITIRRRPIYIIEFKNNDGTNVSLQQVEEGSYIEFQEAAKAGYIFDGWTINGEVVKFPYVVQDNILFESKFIPIIYTITYCLNGGFNDSQNANEYTIEQSVLLKNPSRDYYRFDGWYIDGHFVGTTVSKFPKGTIGNKTLYAKWTPIQYDIEYYLDDGKNHINNVSSYNVEQEITLNNPTKDGYAFLGWFTEDTFENNITKIQIGSNGNKKLYAKWQACENKLVFDGNGATGGSMYDMVIDTDETVALANNTFERLGYTFAGWSTTSNGNVEFDDASNYTMGANSEYRLYAIWQANENRLVFDGNGATSGSMHDMEIDTDETVTLENNTFERFGYTFVGWSTAPNGVAIYTDGTEYTMGNKSENVLYAIWKIEIYEIKYDITNHDNPLVYTVLDLPINLKNPAINNNEKFIGWYNESTFNGAPITQITDIGGAEIYAGLLSSEGLEFVDDGETITVKSYAGTTGLVLIPETVNEKPVTKINSNVFRDFENLKIVYIPKTVISIGVNGNFDNCPSLAMINVDPQNSEYKSIDGNVYSSDTKTLLYYAKGKKDIEFKIPNGVETIEIGAFANSQFLEKVTISNSVKFIGSAAFAKCPSLREVTIGTCVTKIDDFVFVNCDSLNRVYFLVTDGWKITRNLSVIGTPFSVTNPTDVANFLKQDDVWCLYR